MHSSSIDYIVVNQPPWGGVLTDVTAVDKIGFEMTKRHEKMLLPLGAPAAYSTSPSYFVSWLARGSGETAKSQVQAINLCLPLRDHLYPPTRRVIHFPTEAENLLIPLRVIS